MAGESIDTSNHLVHQGCSVTSFSSAIHVQLSTTAENPGLPGIRDDDLDATDPPAHIIPSWNVFGDWKIDGMVNAALTNDRSLQAPCFDWWRIQFPNLPEDMQYPTAPEDYLQYPEWIGPAEAA